MLENISKMSKQQSFNLLIQLEMCIRKLVVHLLSPAYTTFIAEVKLDSLTKLGWFVKCIKCTLNVLCINELGICMNSKSDCKEIFLV